MELKQKQEVVQEILNHLGVLIEKQEHQIGATETLIFVGICLCEDYHLPYTNWLNRACKAFLGGSAWEIAHILKAPKPLRMVWEL